jgi:hypothetical protein
LANSCLFEFEDAIAGFDGADVLPLPVYHDDLHVRVARKAQQAVRLATDSRLGRRPPVPFPTPIRLEHDYDLLVMVLDTIWDLSLVHLVRDWRRQVGQVACVVAEIWDEPFEDWRFKAENFGDFDHFFVSTYHDVDRLSALSGVPCSYLAPGVDTLRFAPPSPGRSRPIRVSYLGRRSEVTHAALQRAAADGGWHYYYDFGAQVEVTDPDGHREWLAQLLRNTSYAITNFARANDPHVARDRRELGYRFFECAAAGAVMLGDPPDVRPFAEQFPWTDAVIPLPFDAADVACHLGALDEQPERIEELRRQSVAGSLARHDWVYRWHEILEIFGLPGTPQMEQRREHLAAEAARWQI